MSRAERCGERCRKELPGPQWPPPGFSISEPGADFSGCLTQTYVATECSPFRGSRNRLP